MAKNNISTKTVLFFSFALFILMLDITSACSRRGKFRRHGRRHSWPIYHHSHRHYASSRSNSNNNNNYNNTEYEEQRYHQKRSVNDYRRTIDTSCGETLCETTRNYPADKIEDGLEYLKNSRWQSIKFTHALGAKGLGIYNRVQKLLSNEKRTFEIAKQCARYTHFYPEEGQSVDGKQYYIINVEGQQLVTKIECKSDCTDEIDGSNAECYQTYQEQKLLALPMDWTSITEIELKSFKVPYCHCNYKP